MHNKIFLPHDNGPGISPGQPPSQAPRGNYLTAFREAFRNPGVRLGYVGDLFLWGAAGTIYAFSGDIRNPLALLIGPVSLLLANIYHQHRVARRIQREGS